MIIDAHTHIGEVLNSPTQGKNWRQILDLLLSEMKANKVGHALVIASSGERENYFAFTESILKIVAGFKNLSVIGSIDPTNYKKNQLDQLEGWLKSKKIVGVKLLPGYQYFYPGSESAHSIYKLCLKYNVPVIFHSGDTYGFPGQAAKVKYSHPLHVDEVAADFPNLKIIIAHLGNPWLMDCAELLYKNANVYADISGLIVPGMKLDSPYGKLMKQRIKELIAYSDMARKLLYGTDWPLAPMKEYLKFAKGLGIKSKDLDRVFYKNVAELFGIKV